MLILDPERMQNGMGANGFDVFMNHIVGLLIIGVYAFVFYTIGKIAFRSGIFCVLAVCWNVGIAIAIYLTFYLTETPGRSAFVWTLGQFGLCLLFSCALYFVRDILPMYAAFTGRVAKGLLLSCLIVVLLSVPSCVALIHHQGGIGYKAEWG
jgi:hypothetical protein